jgi:hypothetical protein
MVIVRPQPLSASEAIIVAEIDRTQPSYQAVAKKSSSAG